MFESSELYITGIKYKDSSWDDSPDELLQTLYDNFNEINGFYFINMSLNMAQIYNVSLKESNYDSMTLYLKGVRYEHEEFLTLEKTKELEQKLTEQLGYVDDLVFDEIEIRNTKKYTDYEMGMIEFK